VRLNRIVSVSGCHCLMKISVQLFRVLIHLYTQININNILNEVSSPVGRNDSRLRRRSLVCEIMTAEVDWDTARKAKLCWWSRIWRQILNQKKQFIFAFNTNQSSSHWVSMIFACKKVKIITWYSAPQWRNFTAKTLIYGTHCRGISRFYLHTHAFIHEWNEPYLPLPSQPRLVLIYRSRRMEGWVGLGTTAVSRQSAHDR